MKGVILVTFALFCTIYTEEQRETCKGVAFKCIPPPKSCPVNQTLVPGTCSCSCKTCKPQPQLFGVGSSCIILYYRGMPTSNCNYGLTCCDKVCVEPRHCC